MMTKERSIQIVNFMTPWAEVLAKWVWPYKSYSENTLLPLKSSSLLSFIDQTNCVYINDDQ